MFTCCISNMDRPEMKMSRESCAVGHRSENIKIMGHTVKVATLLLEWDVMRCHCYYKESCPSWSAIRMQQSPLSGWWACRNRSSTESRHPGPQTDRHPRRLCPAKSRFPHSCLLSGNTRKYKDKDKHKCKVMLGCKVVSEYACMQRSSHIPGDYVSQGEGWVAQVSRSHHWVALAHFIWAKILLCYCVFWTQVQNSILAAIFK